ncbi:MAG TPA: flagellar hook-length control protein FliK, partial [Terriglobia bacterium]|nr:flagellar hook-length control protein FliK [Terriglobia bacterium]
CNGEVKQVVQQNVSTQLNLPHSPDLKLESVIPDAGKVDGTATLDRHQLVAIQYDVPPKTNPSQDGGAQRATAEEWFQVSGLKAGPGTGNAQIQVSVTDVASIQGNPVITSDSVRQRDSKVVGSVLETDAIAKEGTPDTAKSDRQAVEVILSQLGEPKDTPGVNTGAILNGRDVNRLVVEFNVDGKSKAPVQLLANNLGSVPRPEMTTMDKATLTGPATPADSDKTQSESGREETVMNSPGQTVYSNSRSTSQQTASLEGTAIAKEVSPEVNARAAHSLTGFEANAPTDRAQPMSGEKPAIKLQVLPESGAPVNGGGLVSRTASLGEVDQSVIDRPSTPSSAQFWTQAEKASVISQLIEKVHLLNASKNSELMISLKPEFLGRLSVHATMLDDSLVATITADSPAVKSLLESHIPNLQHSLQEQGLSVSKISIVQGNELSFSTYDYSHTSQHHNLQSQQHSRSPWLNPIAPVESDLEESEALTDCAFEPNQSIHLIA